MTDTQTIWLGVGFLLMANFWPILTLYDYLRITRLEKDIIADIEENLLLQNGRRISDEVDARYKKPVPWFGLIGTIPALGAFQSFWPVLVTGFLFYAAREMNCWIDYVDPIINQSHARKRQAIRQQAQAAKFQPHASFEEPNGDDDAFFSSKAQQKRREPPKQERKPPTNKDTPYGFDKRHPKDADLWAKVDDPSATASERHAAFSMILKREAQRKNDSDSRPGSGGTPLIGSDRK